MFRIDPARTDLAREFKGRPFGIHSADLQAVLNYMRTHPAKGNYLLREIAPHRQWMLVEMTDEPPRPGNSQTRSSTAWKRRNGTSSSYAGRR